MPHDDVNPAFLSRFELFGGFIKNIALTVTFMADDDDPPEMSHVIRALRRKSQKMRKLPDRYEFGKSRHLLK